MTTEEMLGEVAEEAPNAEVAATPPPEPDWTEPTAEAITEVVTDAIDSVVAEAGLGCADNGCAASGGGLGTLADVHSWMGAFAGRSSLRDDGDGDREDPDYDPTTHELTSTSRDQRPEAGGTIPGTSISEGRGVRSRPDGTIEFDPNFDPLEGTSASRGTASPPPPMPEKGWVQKIGELIDSLSNSPMSPR